MYTQAYIAGKIILIFSRNQIMGFKKAKTVRKKILFLGTRVSVSRNFREKKINEINFKKLVKFY